MSHRDHADLGTHLSPENRDPYVRDADVHLSLSVLSRLYNNQSTLPAGQGPVNSVFP